MRKLLASCLIAWLSAATAGAAEPSDAPAPSAAEVDGAMPPTVDEGPVVAPGPRFLVDAEYLLWWLREGRLPAPTLATSSQASQGLLGKPDTRVLYGDDRLRTRHGDEFNGVRFRLAYWFDDTETLGIEGDAFFLERDSTHFKAASDGSTLLARPYQNPDGSQASYVIAGDAPGGPRSGGFVGYSRVELYGEEANCVAPLVESDAFRMEALVGARFLQMRDRTDLTAVSRSLPTLAPLFGQEDHYRAADAYYGGQVGLRGAATYGRWSLEMRGEIGLGGNAEKLRAFGQSIYQTPVERLVTPTGLTVQQNNSGAFDRAALNMVSEARLNVGYQCTRHIRVYGGYTFLLWDGPIRSGDQIDTVVNANAGTSPARPGVPFKEDLFWAHGLDAGLLFSW